MTKIASLEKNHGSNPGRFPLRQNTVLADVLATLLEGGQLTGMDAVFGLNTTRLAAPVEALRRAYRWPVHTGERVVATKDGRVVAIAVYSMPSETIQAAYAVGAGEWVSGVHVARSELRRQAFEAQRKAGLDAARGELQSTWAMLTGSAYGR